MLVGVRERGNESFNGSFVELVSICGVGSFDVEFGANFGGFGGSLDILVGSGGRRPTIFCSPYPPFNFAIPFVGVILGRAAGLAESLNSG